MINKLTAISLILISLAANVFSVSSSSSSSTSSKSPPTFHPKVTEPPTPQDLNDYEEQFDESDVDNSLDLSSDDLDDLFAAASLRNSSSSSSSSPNDSRSPVFSDNLNNHTRLALNPLFDFVEFVLQPTSAFENIVEPKSLTNRPPANHNNGNEDQDDDESNYDSE